MGLSLTIGMGFYIMKRLNEGEIKGLTFYNTMLGFLLFMRLKKYIENHLENVPIT